MARKREFNNQKVLNDAAMVFANFGYAGTSIDMLVDKTGLQRGSIYKAFASKAGIFKAALAEYVSRISDTQYKDGIYLDLLIVAVWERASIDNEVHALVSEALTYIKSEGKSISDTFYSRMSERAKLPIELH
jgi:TetR/AcrR family transcriptional repressor of nem operon